MHPLLAGRRRLALDLLAWGLVGLLLGLLVHVQLAVPWTTALAFAVPLGVAAAPLSVSAWYSSRALPLTRDTVSRVAATALASSIVTAALWTALGRGWWLLLSRAGLAAGETPVPALTVLQFGVGMLAYLLAVTIQYLIQAVEASAESARRALEAEVAHRDAELRALRAQVDPHFLFNSLNSIAALVSADPAQARHMCQLLADFLRDSLAVGGAPRIPLGREVALAEQYLRVEEVRFGRRLTVTASVASDCAGAPVPPLILQPLVENAVRHGIATCLDGGAVQIDAHRVGRQALIVVANPRDPDGGRRGTGRGLDLVRRRLTAVFGDHASLAIEPTASSYRVALTVPLEESRDT